MQLAWEETCRRAGDLAAAYRALGSTAVSLERPIGDGVPVAARVERAWQDGTPWNPLFSFESVAPAAVADREALRADVHRLARRSGDPVTAGFAHHLDRQAEWLAALRTHDAAAIDAASTAEHGVVDDDLVAAADAILHQAPAAAGGAGTLPAERVATVLARVLAQAGAQGWSAVVRADLVARMRVSHARRQVELNASVRFDVEEVVRLAVHEVGVHVLRGVRGSAQENPLLGLPLADGYLLTEEGLAVWAEERAGVLSSADRRKYALRVRAVGAARAGGFFDAYAAVRPHLAPQAAFDMTLRVKRGIADTAVPGAYVKDKVYLEGWRRVSALASAEPAALAVLMAGKVSLPLVEAVGELAAYGRVALDAREPLALWQSLATCARQHLAAGEQGLDVQDPGAQDAGGRAR